jgi:hypothetical protein
VTDDPFDHNGECRYCDELGYHRADCSWLLQLIREHALWSAGSEELAKRVDALETENKQLRADYTEAVRLYRERDAQAARYHDRLQIDPGGSDRIDELEAAIEHLRADVLRLQHKEP